MSEEKKLTRKKIEATKLMNKYMSDYFYDLDRASKTGDEKIARITSYNVCYTKLLRVRRKSNK